MKQVIVCEAIFFEDSFKKDSALLIEEGKVSGLIAKPYPQDAEILEWPHMLLLPGTVNCHNHSFQSLLKGRSDDLGFFAWRDVMYQAAKKLTSEGIYVGALFAFAEMIRNGITTVCDFFYIHDQANANAKEIARAAENLGIRLVLARAMYDWSGAPKRFIESVDQASKNTEQLIDDFRGHPFVSVLPAPHSLHAASAKMIQAGSDIAKRRGIPYHIHVAEGKYEREELFKKTGQSPLEYLDSLGVLHENAVLIHGVWLDEKDFSLMKKRGVKLVTNPSANLFLGDGIANIVGMLGGGVEIALGTDGGSANNRLSIFEEMRMVSLLQKGRGLEGGLCPAEVSFGMGTRGGEQILGIKVGRIAKGYPADFVAIEGKDLSLCTGGALLKNIVYSMHPSAIRKVMVGGALILEEGELVRIPFGEIYEKARQIVRGL